MINKIEQEKKIKTEPTLVFEVQLKSDYESLHMLNRVTFAVSSQLKVNKRRM